MLLSVPPLSANKTEHSKTLAKQELGGTKICISKKINLRETSVSLVPSLFPQKNAIIFGKPTSALPLRTFSLLPPGKIALPDQFEKRIPYLPVPECI